MQNVYLSFTGTTSLAGQSTSIQGPGTIELLSYSHGVSMPLSSTPPSNASRRFGRCQHHEFTVTKYLDKATPTLNLYCSGGADLPIATITVYQASDVATSGSAPVPLITYTLENVLISSISVGGGGGDLPIESLALNYTKITWNYAQQAEVSPGVAPAGANTTSWNLATNNQT